MSSFAITQGTDGGARWHVRDSATGLPYDLTGWTARAQIRSNIADPVVLHEFSPELGNAVPTAEGFVYLTWTHVETSAMSWRTGTFDLELTSPEGLITRIASGRVDLVREVTR